MMALGEDGETRTQRAAALVGRGGYDVEQLAGRRVDSGGHGQLGSDPEADSRVVGVELDYRFFDSWRNPILGAKAPSYCPDAPLALVDST